jgi:hypothetical protein
MSYETARMYMRTAKSKPDPYTIEDVRKNVAGHVFSRDRPEQNDIQMSFCFHIKDRM